MNLPEFSDYLPARLRGAEAAAEQQAWLQVEPPPRFAQAYERPGQFCKMRVQGAEGIFAMFSPPGQTPVRFLVRVGSPDGGEAADLLSDCSAGTEIEMTHPAGLGFDLDRARGKDVVFVATGTGVAPVSASIEVVLRDRTSYGELSLIHGVRSEAHVAISESLARWRERGVRTTLCYSEVGDGGLLRGVTVQDALLEAAPDLQNAAVVAVGQPAMLQSLLEQVVGLGGDPGLFLQNI